jgi:hypothetical protein
MALVILGQIKLKYTLQALDRLSTQAGFSEIEGMLTLDWIQQQEALQLQEALIKLEDQNPAVAAHMQRVFDESSKSSGAEPGEE